MACQSKNFLAGEINFRMLVLGSIPTRGPCAAFLAVVPGQLLKCIYIHLDY